MHRLLALVFVLGLAGAPAALAGTAACSEGNYAAALKVQEAETAPGANTQPASTTQLTRTSTGVYVLDVAANIVKITFTPPKGLELASMQPDCMQLAAGNVSITCGGVGASLLPVPLATCGSPTLGYAGTTRAVLADGSSQTISVDAPSSSGASGSTTDKAWERAVTMASGDEKKAMYFAEEARREKTADEARRDANEMALFLLDALKSIGEGRPPVPYVRDEESIFARLQDARKDAEDMQMVVKEDEKFTPPDYARDLHLAEEDIEEAEVITEQVM